MRAFGKSSDRPVQRLHPSPSLPNLCLLHQALSSPLASPITTPTANRAHLGPLDLAPSKTQHRSPSPSPSISPRRPPLPLTPPLTPSSLNDNASQGGFPATPTDFDSTNIALQRRKSKYLAQKGLPTSGLDDFGDTTPTDRPYFPLGHNPQLESNSRLSSYLRLDTSPSRFLLISNVPKSVTNEGIKSAFAPYGASKGIWTGHLQSLGIVILAFHDLRHAESACRAVRSGKAHTVFDGVQHAIQLHSGFISVAEARDLTGNPSPVTEIEEEAAFLIQIKDHSTQPSTVRSILDRFGTLLVFREWHVRTGDGQWFYVEYYDVRETQAAYQDLHDRPHVLGAQFSLYNTKLLPPLHSSVSAPLPLTEEPGLDLQNVVPFPSTEAPITEGPLPQRSARPRSASAEAGDGVKAFSLASTRLAEDLRRRITAPADWEPEFVDRPGERRRSQSFDESQRFVDSQESSSAIDHHYQEPCTYGRRSQEVIYGHAQIGAYDLHSCTRSFIPAGPTTFTPEYILPRPAHGHSSRRIAPSHTHLTLQRASTHTTQNQPKYRSPPLHEPSEQQMDNNLNIARIQNGQDMRTTVMIKNIPNKMTDKDLMNFIERVCTRRIDFFYLRMDFKNGCNVGYAFVNFITVDDLLRFAKARLGVRWNMYASEKVLQMSYANYQGKEALVEKFKNSAIMDERDSWRPKIFHSSGPQAGQPEPFPAPTHQRRKERSAHNRGALYVPGAARLHSVRTEDQDRGERLTR
ncbi:RNA recognition motif 2-domain-containing protein [Russula earlei]|uniref:RNA recognition motif 2-domain-containing protein n=1 Tax=Russula earlei TaxID=71964 RepID=A0ACC0UGC8_9AGAM|nr:RNA recognition motif 2-domain-containing protein [Russula earlei]